MGRERTWSAAAASIALALGLIAGTACSASEPGAADRLHPIDADGATDDRATDDRDVGPENGTPQAEAPVPGAPGPTVSPPVPPGPDAADAERAVIDGLLARYDRALTDLAADPAAVSTLGHPLLLAWQSVVTPGTALADDLPAAITARRAGGVVIRPSTDGISYRHRALQVVPSPDGSLSFTWCAWSPGIGYDAATGAVVDDAVGHAHGTGRGHAVDGIWRLDALDQSDLVALPPGTPDPCRTEVLRTAGR